MSPVDVIWPARPKTYTGSKWEKNTRHQTQTRFRTVTARTGAITSANALMARARNDFDRCSPMPDVHLDQDSGGRVPQRGRAVGAAGGQGLAVRAERHRIDIDGAGCQVADLLAGSHPQCCAVVVAGADLRDVQIAAHHAGPRTTMRYDRARNNLDRHPNYILAAYMASGT
jgi:hypothetical protein